MKTALTTLALLATLGAGAAHAQSAEQAQAVAQVLQRNADRQAGVAVDLARGIIDARAAAFLEARQARLYGMEAGALDRGAPLQDLATIDRVQSRIVVVFDSPASRAAERAAERLDALHERVAALRDAEQQRSIARGWTEGRFTLQQVAQLEANQAQLAGLQV